MDDAPEQKHDLELPHDFDINVKSDTKIIPNRFRFAFSRSADLALLHQTFAQNPFEPGPGSKKLIWDGIAEALRSSDPGMAVTGRSCKERVTLLGVKLLNASELTIESISLLIELRAAQPNVLKNNNTKNSMEQQQKKSKSKAFKSNGNGPGAKFTRPRFEFRSDIKYDLALLEQVQALNPMGASSPAEAQALWEQIANNLRNCELQMLVTRRSCRDRTLLLQKQLLQEQQQGQDQTMNLNEGIVTSDELTYGAPQDSEVPTESQQYKEQDWTSTTTTETQFQELSGVQIQGQPPIVGSVVVVHADNNSNVIQKLSQLDSRVQEIEKQLTIIFGLISALDSSSTSRSAPSKQKQVPNPNTATKKSSRLNLNPIVKLQKLSTPVTCAAEYNNNVSSPSPACTDDDDDVDDELITAPFIKIEPQEESTADFDQSPEPTTVGDFFTETTPSFSSSKFICPHCPNDKHYSTNEQLTKHLLIHQVLDLEESAPKMTNTTPSAPARQRKHQKHSKTNTYARKLLQAATLQSIASARLHTSLQQLQRSRCSSQTKSKLKSTSSGVGSFKCEHCPKIFQLKHRLQRHTRTEHDSTSARPTLTCSKCSKSFKSKSTLHSHSLVCGVLETPYKCPTCGKGFKRRDYLTQHIEIHSELRKYKCSYCEASFRQRKGWQIHKSLHLLNLKGKAQCSLCGQLFVSQASLKIHIRVIHDKIRAYGCEQCGKRFKTRTHLKYHVGTHENPNGRRRGLNRDVGSGEVKIKRLNGGITYARQISADEEIKGKKLASKD